MRYSLQESWRLPPFPTKKIDLEPETSVYKWLFQLDDSKSLYRKWLFHQTSISNWLFRVPGRNLCPSSQWFAAEPGTETRKLKIQKLPTEQKKTFKSCWSCQTGWRIKKKIRTNQKDDNYLGIKEKHVYKYGSKLNIYIHQFCGTLALLACVLAHDAILPSFPSFLSFLLSFFSSLPAFVLLAIALFCFFLMRIPCQTHCWWAPGLSGKMSKSCLSFVGIQAGLTNSGA